MSSILDGVSRPFDLLRNPFFVLKVQPGTPVDQIAEAAEDALADGEVAEADITAARESLINPRLRTAAELSYLFDVPPGHVARLVGTLANLSPADILREAERAAPLSRSNLLTEAASHLPASSDILFSVLDAHAQTSPPNLLAKIQSLRRQAGLVSPSLGTVEETLNSLYEQHVKSLLGGFKNAKGASGPLRECTKRILAAPDDDRLRALDRLLRAYAQFASSELGEIEEHVTPVLEQLKTRSATTSDTDDLSSYLQNWLSLAQPMIDTEARKGRDEPRSRELCLTIRSFCIDRANHHNDFASALAINEIALEAFKSLPRASEQLIEDAQLLKERLTESKIVPLKNFIDGTSKWTIAADISSGFGPSAKGLASELWMLFATASRDLQHSTYSDLPWILVRELAIQLNNEEDSPEAAKSILEQLLRVVTSTQPSPNIVEQLRTDLRAVSKNGNEKRVLKIVDSGDTSAALSGLDELLNTELPPDERAVYAQLKKRLQGKRNANRTKWAAFALIAAVIIGINVSNNSEPTPRQQTPSTRTTQTIPSPHQTPGPASDVRSAPPPVEQNDTAEVKPPIGSGSILTRSNIRYCRYQKARLTSIENEPRTSYEGDEFNKLVNDYNPRCANFRYYENDLRAIDNEVAKRGAELIQDGLAIVAAWRRSNSPSASFDARGAAPNVTTSRSSTENPVMPSPRPERSGWDDPATNLLNIETANAVQKRLLDLGYFKGPLNGTWGPQSRTAMRAFKGANGLPNDDIYDAVTSQRMSSSVAVRASVASKSEDANVESHYASRSGATINPLNRDDAARIHTKLRELGYYRANSNTLWSAASREALKEFKTRNGLGASDAWDSATEQKLMAATAPTTAGDIESAFSNVVIGEWTTDLRACQGSSSGSDALVVTMTSKGARTDGARCDFQSFSGSGLNWKIAAICSASGETRKTTISLSRSNDTLTWSSDKGIAKYLRCPS